MSAKVKTARKPPLIDTFPPIDLGPTILITPEMRREKMCALGVRIEGHIRFMCQADGLAGVSVEAKERALTIFHEHLTWMERELARIGVELQLE
jgi:hypothetical protein